MKILYSGVQYNNYDPPMGLSFEHNNFYLGLLNYPGAEIKYFPYDRILEVGKKRWNQELLEAVKNEKPDLLFCFMFTDEFDKEILKEISKSTTTSAWFADDHWRLDNYSRFYAPYFTWSVTTWSKAPAQYQRYGIRNLIRSQWACNPAIWKPIEIERDIDVSFVGQYNSARAKTIETLRAAGINVYVRGWGWPEGRVSQEEMIRIFSRSKINLNFNIPPSRWDRQWLGRLLFKRSINRIVLSCCHPISNFKSWLKTSILQIKARPFELAGCRAFIISGYADDMENYYKENEEMVFYRSLTDLIEKIKYYLPRESEREKIAQAGYERTINEHIYQKRFEKIFKTIFT